MKTKFPEYNHSIVSLTNSILKCYGVENPHDTLPEVDEVLAKKEYRNVVLMVFDGMGTYNLERILAGKFFKKASEGYDFFRISTDHCGGYNFFG